MCGIWALSRADHSSIPDSRRFVLAALLAIEERGPDSTGVAYTQGRQRNVWYDKRVGPASKVAGRLDLGSGKSPLRTVIGHTRWASQGALTYDNAHPVLADNIVLVHNGVVTNDDELAGLGTAERVGEVDSWALATIIHNAAAIGGAHPCDVLALVEGDAAVAWFDTGDPSLLNLARLTGRPMTIGWTNRGDLVMSSTRATLLRTSRLTGVDITDIIDVPTFTYLAVRGGKIVEWRTIGKPEAVTPKPQRGQQRLDLVRTEVPKRRKAAITHPTRKRGITDIVAERPTDWWDEAERLLGDDVHRFERLPFEWNDADPWRRKR